MMAKLTTMQHRTLVVLAAIPGPDNWGTTEEVAAATRSSSRSNAYTKLASLRGKGLVEQGGLKSWWRITDAGRAALTPPAEGSK